MNGPFSATSPACVGGGIRRHGGTRRRIASVVAFLLLFATLLPVASASIAVARPTNARSFEERASDERTSRSRFRRLEVASFVLILLVGGVVTLWAIRRK